MTKTENQKTIHLPGADEDDDGKAQDTDWKNRGDA